MADVRSMLRNERASRRATRPGSKPQPTPVAPPAPSIATKKRKAIDDEEDEPAYERKRTKAEELNNLPAGFFDGGNETAAITGRLEENFVPAEEIPAKEDTAPVPSVPDAAPTTKAPAPTIEPEVDEDEWAAFERDVATPPPINALTALQESSATISAAPLSAAELAAQAREEQSRQRGRRDEEIEAEKEDAERALEEEFDEMEQFEERIRRLKEKREKLRAGSEKREDEDAEQRADAGDMAPSSEGVKPAEDESSDEDYDEEDFDDWRYRGS